VNTSGSMVGRRIARQRWNAYWCSWPAARAGGSPVGVFTHDQHNGVASPCVPEALGLLVLMAHGGTAGNCVQYGGMALLCKQETYNPLVQLALAPAQCYPRPAQSRGVTLRARGIGPAGVDGLWQHCR